MRSPRALLITVALFAAACGPADEPSSAADTTAPLATTTPDTTSGETTASTADGVGDQASSYVIEVWADNWMAVHVDGQLVGEDSVPITTERSFNAETFMFEATVPFTVAIEAKDFTETDSGLEYIGERNQQMGDGGLIAQITDLSTGDVVAATDSGWRALVVHQAPLNTECADDPDPDRTCEFLVIDTPAGWAAADFDDSGWTAATVWGAADVDPKDGYDEIDWDPSAELIWGTDLEIDNTVLLRTVVP